MVSMFYWFNLFLILSLPIFQSSKELYHFVLKNNRWSNIKRFKKHKKVFHCNNMKNYFNLKKIG